MCCNGNNNFGKDNQHYDRAAADRPEPFAQVCISSPLPCPIPLCPCPVKPLQLPCPHHQGNNNGLQATDAYIDKLRSDPNNRYDNFYNNYNVDWHSDGQSNQSNYNGQKNCVPPQANGTTVDGQSPCCEDYKAGAKQQQQQQFNAGCPTGFKPCKLKLTPPPGCSPCGCWTADLQNCPPKSKKKDLDLANQPCTRPCCLHWEDKGGPCLYDDPCKAHCFNHPPGMKPSGRFP